MLCCGQVKQKAKLWVVLLLEHDSLLKGATVLHDVHSHGVNDVADALISWKRHLDVWNCSGRETQQLRKVDCACRFNDEGCR